MEKRGHYHVFYHILQPAARREPCLQGAEWLTRNSDIEINLCDDAGAKYDLQFLMTRKFTHRKAFMAALVSLGNPMTQKISWFFTLLVSILAPATAFGGDLGIVRMETRSPDGSIRVRWTGTHIGKGLILTCGHCCRAAGGPGTKSIAHIISSETLTSYRTAIVTTLCYDDEADVGLMLFDQPGVLRTAYALAPRGFAVEVGNRVRAYRWVEVENEEQITSFTQSIIMLDRFIGPDNIETNGVPQQGTSGGPLITVQSSLIVGVTSAADPADQQGIYCGLEPIYQLLDHHASHANKSSAAHNAERQTTAASPASPHLQSVYLTTTADAGNTECKTCAARKPEECQRVVSKCLPYQRVRNRACTWRRCSFGRRK